MQYFPLMYEFTIRGVETLFITTALLSHSGTLVQIQLIVIPVRLWCTDMLAI